jgi:hypothetical protein
MLFCRLIDLTDVKEERICIKLSFKLGKTQAELHKIHKEAFGDNALGLAQSYERFNLFKKGRMSLDDDERSARPSTGSTPESVEDCDNQRYTTFVTLSNCCMKHFFCNPILFTICTSK